MGVILWKVHKHLARIVEFEADPTGLNFVKGS